MRRILYAAAACLLVAALSACSADKYTEGYYDSKYYESSTSYLTLRNFSSDTTFWFIPEKEYALSLPEELSEWQKISIYEVAPHSSYILTFDSSDSYVTPEETYGPEDSMAIYVFSADAWKHNSWQELVRGSLWTCSGLYSVEDILSLDGIVTYPMRP